ncbi:hypothetical protein GCM10028805_18530 [Spirosoma harenae]
MFRTTVYASFILLTISQLPATSQVIDKDPDPTRWINYTQTYYKIPIAQTGLYRITKTQLKQRGFPIDQIDPKSLQLFHRGTEQAIYVDGEEDNQFDARDYLEFFGQRNDGTQDSLLYRPHKDQPHTYYSLFSDATAYFLTWLLDGQPGRRMKAYTDTAFANLSPETYHWAEELRLFTDDYPGWPAGLSNKSESSYYEAGEGYTGIIQQINKPFHNAFQLTDPIRNGPNPQVDIQLIGRDITNHRIDYLLGPTTLNQFVQDSIRFAGYITAHSQFSAGWSSVNLNGQLVVSTVSRGNYTSTDPYSVSYIRLRYPQKLTLTKSPFHILRLEANPVGRSRLEVADLLPNTSFWDITDPNAPIRIGATWLSADSARLIVHQTETSRTILAVSTPTMVPSIQSVHFTNWSNRKPTYLIISHEALMNPGQLATGDSVQNAVRAYAAYRATAIGGGHDTLTVTMQQLIDQYSYGERHPLAIRRFTRQMIRQNLKGTLFLLLAGRSRSTPGIRRNPHQSELDQVMTAGFPGSDGAFTTGLIDGEPDVPALPTGRINAATPQEVINYLEKVKEYEKPTSDTLWQKKFLHLSGGQTAGELNLFRHLVDAYQEQVIKSSLGAQVHRLSKTTLDPVESSTVVQAVNEGVRLLTFFGHSGLDATDLEIGLCTNDQLGYHNKSKYPLLLINGCAIGNFFFGRPTLATDWVLAPNRGAIAAIAHSHLGYADIMHPYTTTFYQLLTDNTQRYKSIGQIQQETIRRVLSQSADKLTLANCQQMVLQGDPAIRLFPLQLPADLINPTANQERLLLTVYPNPFREQVRFSIQFIHNQLPDKLTLTITDLTGRIVRQLTTAPHTGQSEFVWNGRDNSGNLLPSGIYFYKLTIPETIDLSAPVSDNQSARLQGRILFTR